jgi:hypothetical protein
MAVEADRGTYAPMRRDFELLRATAEAERWSDTTCVGPAFFGPLWSL